MAEWLRAFEGFWAGAVQVVWGLPFVCLLLGAGVFFTAASRFLPFWRWPHAWHILRGKFDRRDDPGEISHFAALATALAATIGMGNIAGVAIAIGTGGPGAVFWMWVAGLVGMATKYFCCTLAVLHRKKDWHGVVQGGPMYFLEVGLGPWARPLAVLFAACGMIGCLALFQMNQLAALLESDFGVPKAASGLTCMVLVGAVILGGIVRVGTVSRWVVPAMVVLYFGSSLVILGAHITRVPGVLAAIVSAAFGGGAVVGGATGLALREVVITGVRRAVFSNEAGIGTAPMAHGAARTAEPVREGLIAMLGPLLDTHVVCTLTALVILTTGVPYVPEQGVVMTMNAYASVMGEAGRYLLVLITTLFALTTMISYSYYSLKCARYLFGERLGSKYIYVYLAALPLAALSRQTTVINIIDTCFALMAIPNLTGTLLLSGEVLHATRDYFARMARGGRVTARGRTPPRC